MANVLFKRGTQDALPASGSAVDGALYFTTDTRRLFLGLSDHSLIPIAEGITSVGNATSLPTASQHTGEFYYIAPSTAAGGEAGNILAYSDGTRWLQVNMPTYITSATETVTVSENVATIQLQTTDNKDAHVTASYDIVGGDNVTLTVSNGDLVISVPDDQNTLYTMTASANGNNVDLTLAPTSATTVTGASASTVTFKDSTSVNVFLDDGAITFSVKTGGVGSVDTVSIAPGLVESNGGTLSAGDPSYADREKGFHVDLGLSNNSHVAGNVRPVIAYGPTTSNSATVYTSSVEFVNGVASLDVYSKSQIDTRITNLENGLNAMTYRGVASSESTITSTTIHNGDVWKATSSFSIDGKEVKPGYLIIAQGEETNGVIPTGSASFDVVAGDSTDTTYSFSDYTPTVTNYTTHAVTYSEYLAFLNTDFAVNGNNVSLATVTVSTTTGAAKTESSGQSMSFDAVTNVSYDAKGRITGIETTTITVVDTAVKLTGGEIAVSSSSNVATISFDVQDTADAHAGDAFKLASAGNTITITTSTTTDPVAKIVNIDLVWEEFS